VGKLSEALAALDKGSVLAAVQEGIGANVDPLELVEEARRGLEVVGKEFDKGNYFLMELLRGAQIFKDAVALISPKIKERYGSATSKGKVVIGTVAGDVHDLGKNIVRDLLQCNGFEVIDLGVDVPAQAFVQAIKEHRPRVVGMSALLTAAVAQVERTVQAIEEAGLRHEVRVIVGGGIVGEVKRTTLRVDHATTNANEGVSIIAGWFAGSDAGGQVP